MKNKFIRRLLTFMFGLFVMAMGVALSVKANLGVSPVSCIPYVYSLWLPLSLGTLTIALNILIILMQVILLRKNFKIFQLVQLPVVFIFGMFIDLCMYLISDLEVHTYLWQAILCLVSCFTLALGVFFEIKANITFLPGEGLALAISETFKKEFGKAKVGVDSSMVIVGVISSYIFLHELQGIREGTILAAILVGFIVKFFSKILQPVSDRLAIETPAELSDSDNTNKNNPVITVSREYGSGGHEIGQLIAKKLGLAFYDKELIELTAERSGFSTEYIKKNEQKLAHNLLSELFEQNYAYINEQHPPLDALFLVQSKIIREICAKESCVIVGRCANFVLKDTSRCFNVFIHADIESKKKRIREEYGVEKEITEKELETINKERSRYCLHYTGRDRHDASNYHMTINSSQRNAEEIAQLIINAIEVFDK